MRAARRKPGFGTAQLVLLLAAGCSLQDFDYLQKGTGGSNAGGTDSSAGTSAAGTESGEGGEAAGSSSGGKGGESPSGGSKSGGSTSGGSATGGTGGGGTGGGGGSGATGELVNGSFETNTTFGWTVTPATTFAFTQRAQGSATIPDGIYQFSTWAEKAAFKVDLHQTIKGLDDGTYVFKGYFNLGGNFNGVELYASDCGGKDPEPIAILPAGASAWLPVMVEGIDVKGGSCTVGLRIDSNAMDWLNADLFTFELDPNATPGGGGAGGEAGVGGAGSQ